MPFSCWLVRRHSPTLPASGGFRRAGLSHWSPSPTEISELESHFQTFLLDRQAHALRMPPIGVAYDREYVGFLDGKTRLIYANFFPAQLERPKNLRSLPVVVCDGGSVFWGVVYNPATKVFEEPQFNGPP